MLDKLVLAAFGRTSLERVVRQELERLEKGGFLPREELERLSAECTAALAGQVERARGLVEPALGPVLGDLAARVREALDVPSRAEVVALTEALRRAERPGAPDADGGRAAAPDDDGRRAAPAGGP
ncbi:MAG: hypothetical protein M9894_01010 [Planctomycetes bacterium]|nr:hypothetical protein [Planctomycetota bacterium]